VVDGTVVVVGTVDGTVATMELDGALPD
jgi:hypothetical protein